MPPVSRTVRSYLRLVALVLVIGGVVLYAVRAGDDTTLPPPRGVSPPPGTSPTGADRLVEARTLLDPTRTGKVTDEQVACVATAVVDNPAREQIASNMGRIRNKDMQQVVMASYLSCAFDFVLDTYMAYAPADLTMPQRACIRATYTKLELQRLAEVIVVDPDAAQTGPLVVKACTTGGDGGDPFAGVAPPPGVADNGTSSTTGEPPPSPGSP